MLGKIDFVSNQRNDNVRVGLLLKFLDPMLGLLEGLGASNVIDDDGS